MEYKFKEGDKVRIKPGMDLERLSITGEEYITKLTDNVLTITDATPGQEGWDDEEYTNTPTYTVTGGWRVAEAFLEEVKDGD